MPWLPYDDADRYEFTTLAYAYAACRDSLRSLSEISGWKLISGSQAARDRDTILARQPPLPAGVELAPTAISQTYLYAAAELLAALAALYQMH